MNFARLGSSQRRFQHRDVENVINEVKEILERIKGENRLFVDDNILPIRKRLCSCLKN